MPQACGRCRECRAGEIRRVAYFAASLILHGRDEGKLEAFAQTLLAEGAAVTVVSGALDEPDAARAVAERALATGPIDILVNNAGGAAAGGGNAEWFDAKPEDWLVSYSANVISDVAVTQAIAPQMIDRKWGRIVQITSAIVDNPISTIPDINLQRPACWHYDQPRRGVARRWRDGKRRQPRVHRH